MHGGNVGAMQANPESQLEKGAFGKGRRHAYPTTASSRCLQGDSLLESCFQHFQVWEFGSERHE